MLLAFQPLLRGIVSLTWSSNLQGLVIAAVSLPHSAAIAGEIGLCWIAGKTKIGSADRRRGSFLCFWAREVRPKITPCSVELDNRGRGHGADANLS
jgi:hypothetical protein